MREPPSPSLSLPTAHLGWIHNNPVWAIFWEATESQSQHTQHTHTHAHTHTHTHSPTSKTLVTGKGS